MSEITPSSVFGIFHKKEKQKPEEKKTPADLVNQAELLFQSGDYDGLNRVILQLGEELGVELGFGALKETIEGSQKVYDYLGISSDLKKEYQQGKIELLSKEDRERAEKEGYTLSLIIPGGLPREEIVNLVRSKYQQEIKKSDNSASEGIHFWDQATRDFPQTQATKKTNPQFYQMMFKPEKECLDAHPETKEKTFPQCQDILEQEKQRTKLNLRGFTLPEYLILDAYHFSQAQKHLDQDNWSWLLAETTKDNARCLDAVWDPVDAYVFVISDVSSNFSSDWGARVGAVSRRLSP